MNKMMNSLCADFGPRPHDRAQPKATNQPGRSMQLEPMQRRGRRGVTDGSRAARKAGRAPTSCGVADGHGGGDGISPGWCGTGEGGGDGIDGGVLVS
jgi:hypothetical protein